MLESSLRRLRIWNSAYTKSAGSLPASLISGNSFRYCSSSLRRTCFSARWCMSSLINSMSANLRSCSFPFGKNCDRSSVGAAVKFVSWVGVSGAANNGASHAAENFRKHADNRSHESSLNSARFVGSGIAGEPVRYVNPKGGMHPTIQNRWCGVALVF